MEINSVFRGFRIISNIGSGSFSSIWLCDHEFTNEKVVMKIIKKSENQSEEKIRRVMKEINILKSIDHPLIIQFLEDFEDDDNYYIIQEYAPNGSLFDLLNSKSNDECDDIWEESMARRYFCQILVAVEYLHQNHIFHRDLKAENILLDKNNNIRIIDFGFSESYETDDQKFSELFGSPGYAPPEMARNEGYTPNADIWSLGIILYCLLVGKLPFIGEDDKGTIEKIVFQEPEYSNFLSTNEIDLLKKLLNKNPNLRITLEQIKEHPFMSKTEISIVSQLNPKKNQRPILDSNIVFQLTMMNIDISLVNQQKEENIYGNEFVTYLVLKAASKAQSIRDLIEMRGSHVVRRSNDSEKPEIQRRDRNEDHRHLKMKRRDFSVSDLAMLQIDLDKNHRKSRITGFGKPDTKSMKVAKIKPVAICAKRSRVSLRVVSSFSEGLSLKNLT